MKPVNTLRRVVQDVDSSAQMLTEIREGVSNQSALIDRKMSELIGVCDSLLQVQKVQIEITGELTKILAGMGNAGVNTAYIEQKLLQAAHIQPVPIPLSSIQENIPLMRGEKTYNTAHPHYDVKLVRNFPGTIFNHNKSCRNNVYKELLKLAKGDQVPDKAWKGILEEMLVEARSVPHAGQVFERMEFIQNYMKEISQRYGAQYGAGWVNLEDALFLYWLVRRLKPRTIVQSGVCNGLSSAFMMLALAKNGPEGKLHVVDLGPVFNPNDPAWTIKGKTYGIVIPEGKSSGWMVADAYRDRFEVLQGDAKEILPPLIERLGGIDMFYHDSDHTYNHMMFEFREAKKKLTPGGLIVGDDISWNASVWDFADEHGVPSYNYKGAVGVAFF